MTGIGGRASPGAIEFVGSRYVSKVKFNKDNSYFLTLKYAGGGKSSTPVGRLLRVPVFRGLYKLWRGSASGKALIAVLIAMCVLSITGCDRVNNLLGYVPDNVFIALSVIFCAAVVIYLVLSFKNHGAEHMAINACSSYGIVTEDNIRESSRVANRCGTNMLSIMAVLVLIMDLVINMDINIEILLALALSYELLGIKDGYKKPLLKYIYKLGFFIQRYIVTRQPEDFRLVGVADAINLLVRAESGSMLTKDYELMQRRNYEKRRI